MISLSNKMKQYDKLKFRLFSKIQYYLFKEEVDPHSFKIFKVKIEFVAVIIIVTI